MNFYAPSLALVETATKIVEAAATARAEKNNLSARHQISRHCRKAKSQVLALADYPYNEKWRRAKVSMQYKKQWKKTAQRVAARLESYDRLALSNDDGELKRIQDGYTKVLLRIVCGSWLELDDSDIGLPERDLTPRSALRFITDKETWSKVDKVAFGLLPVLTAALLLMRALIDPS